MAEYEIIKELSGTTALALNDNKVYVLYSKSGFTSEVKRIAKKDNSLILYGLEDF